MPKAAIFTLAWLVATTAADSLKGPFKTQVGHERRNETSDSRVYLHGSIPSSTEGLSLSPGVLPTATTLSTTTNRVPHEFAPTGTMPPRLPRPSGAPRPSANGTCHGATVNIVGASLDWWFTETTYTQVDSTFLVQVNSNASSTAWTLLPATETFDVTSAVANPSCTSSKAFNPEANATMLQYSCVDTPTPVAAATTTVEQTAYMPMNATTSTGAIPDLVTVPTPAAITVANANGSSTYAAGTPFVHFSQFNVVSKRPFLYGDGRVGCAETTQVHTMARPGSFEYTGGDVNGSYAAVAGDVHPDVLSLVGQPNATAGSFVAEPTVVVVVHKILAAQRMFAMIQPAAGELETPEATLPPSLSTVRETPTETGVIWSPLAVHVESTQSFLAVPTRSKPPESRKAAATTKAMPIVVPFVARFESQDVTLAMPMNPNAPQAVITAIFNGAPVTATAVRNGNPDRGDDQNSQPSNRDGVGRVLSSIFKAAQASSAASQVDGNGNGNGKAAAPGAPHAGGSQGGREPNSSPQNAVNAGAVTIGSSTLPVLISSLPDGPELVIGDRTVSPGGAAITIDGTRISMAPSATALIIGSSTIHLAPTVNPGKVANIPFITVGSKTWTANAATQFNIGGTVITPGGTAVAFGSTVSLGPSANRIVVNGKTQALHAPVITPAPQLTIGSTVYRPNIGSTYNVGSQILTRGGQVVASGTTISLAADGATLVVDGLARPVGSGGLKNGEFATITAPPVLNLNGEAFAANGGASYLISGQTLTPGGAITIEGPLGKETIFLNLAANGMKRIANGYTATSAIGLIGAAPGGAPVLTINGETYSAQDYQVGRGATYMIDEQTLTPGGKITLSGIDNPETISLLAEGTAIVSARSGSTTTSSIHGAYLIIPTNAPILTVAGEVLTAINDGATYVINGQSLTPGGSGTVTVNGHTYTISLSPHATTLELRMGGQGGKAVSSMLQTLYPAQMPSTTIYNTESAGNSMATQSATSNDRTSSGGSAEDERSTSGTSSSLTLFSGGVLTIVSLSALAFLT